MASALTQSERTVIIKRSRRGNLLRLIKEKYQRQDVLYGTLKGDALNEKQLISLMDEKTPRKTIGILHADVLLQEIDAIEQLATRTSFIILQSALAEVKNQNLAAFKRSFSVISNSSSKIVFMPDEHIKDITEMKLELSTQATDSINSAKTVAIHLQELLPEEYKVVVVSNTVQSFEDDDSDVELVTMRKYLEKYVLPDDLNSSLFDVLSRNITNEAMEIVGDDKHYVADTNYTPYLTTEEMSEGLRIGKYYRGTLRVQKDNWQECYVMVYNYQGQSRVPITIKGKTHVNRAIDGDTVVVEVFDNFDNDISDDRDIKEDDRENSDEVVIASSEAPVTALDLEALPINNNNNNNNNNSSSTSVTTSKESLTTTGKLYGCVRGILKRFHASFVCSVDQEYPFNRITQGDVSSPALQMIRCLPVNKRLPPVFITIQESHLPTILDCKIIVAFDLWSERSLYPMGHYVRNMGLAGDKDVETDVLLQELLGTGHSIKDGSVFSTEVMACVPTKEEWMEYMEKELWKSSFNIQQQQSAVHVDRLDLRHLPIVSVDPPGCKDIDDALHCIWLENGHIQAGVHIADVSHYVLPESPLDLEAARRSTSVYLVNKRIDMLPEALTTTICSLRSEEDHLTMSVLWELDLQGNIYNVSFHKSVIRSKASLTYAQAQAKLDQAKEKKITVTSLRDRLRQQQQQQKQQQQQVDYRAYNEDEVLASLMLLFELSEVWHTRRIEQGALTLSSGQEIRFQFEEPAPVTAGDKNPTNNFTPKGDPTSVTAYQTYATNRMVEEWMLLANITVAKKILQQYPTASVLRRHAAPRRSQLEPLVLLAKKRLEIDIDISTSKTLAMSLDHAAEILEQREKQQQQQQQQKPTAKRAAKDNNSNSNNTPKLSSKGVQQLLRIMTTRCMQPAQYFCSGESSKEHWFHYGLAAPVYTHFTSPIRRYADILVHRLLSASLGLMSLPASALDRMRSQEVCVHMNRRHRAAQLAQRASVQLYTTLYFKERARKILQETSMDIDVDEESLEENDSLHEKAAEEVDAFVMSVESDSLIVLIPKFGLEGRLTLPTSSEESSGNDEEVSVRYDQAAGYVQVFNRFDEEILRITCFQSIRCKVCLVSTKKRAKKSQSTATDAVDRSPLKIFFIPPSNYFG